MASQTHQEDVLAFPLQLVYLSDAEGIVQVLLSSFVMLDLIKLEQLLERDLTAMAPSDVQRLIDKGRLSDLPLTQVNKRVVSIVDQSVDHSQCYRIRSQSTDHWLDYAATDMEQLRAHAQQAMISQAVVSADELHDTSTDLAQVNQAISTFTVLRIKQRLQETLDLPPMPETCRRIIELRVDPYAETRALAGAIELDPGMSAQVLGWARSPFYGARKDINTVEDAVIRVLGFDLVINLALGLSLGKAIAVPRTGPHGYANIWQQALVVATICQRVAQRQRLAEPGLAYLCGLLHNYGFLILGHVFPPQFDLVNRHIEANPHLNRYLIEYQILGMTREQCTSCLMQQWQMPEEVGVVIRHYHEDEYDGDHDNMVALLHCVSRTLRRLNFGDGCLQKPVPSMLEKLGIDYEDLKTLCQSVLDQQDEFSDIVRLLHNHRH